jgi:hypothetical protein
LAILKNKDSFHLITLHEKVAAGALYFDAVWMPELHGTHGFQIEIKHSHDFDEIIGFFGGSCENYRELNAEIERNGLYARQRPGISNTAVSGSETNFCFKEYRKLLYFDLFSLQSELPLTLPIRRKHGKSVR